MARIKAAAAPYFEGKAVTARAALQRLAEDPGIRADPLARLVTLETLLDVCIRSYPADCMGRYSREYLDAHQAAPPANEVQKRNLARKLAYYVDSASHVLGSPELNARILQSPAWGHENPANADLYIRRQILLSNVYLSLGRRADAERTVDKVLSLIASLKNPQEGRTTVAWALGDVIGTLTAIGETERAWGVYTVSREFIWRALSPLTVEALGFRLVEAQLLQEVGALKASATSLDAAVAQAGAIELDDDVRTAVLAEAHALKAVVCVADGQLDCARAAVAAHPLNGRFDKGEAPASAAEVTYLASRALVAAAGGSSDARAAAALKAAVDLPVDADTAAMLDVYRAAGAALGLPRGNARDSGLFDAGRRLARAADRRAPAAFGAWYRPGAVDQLIIALALSGQATGPQGDDDAFALFQLAARRGPAFDADALTALAQAGDASQRRTVHQVLRLRARRDRFERQQLQAMAARASAPYSGALLVHDVSVRRPFRDFATRIDTANVELTRRGISTGGANLVSLKRFQTALQPGEAALSVTTALGGGLAYLCVRRDSVVRTVAPADLKQTQVDVKIVQAALTAGHAPSDALDSQFPVEASMRLYDVLIRPFEGCLRNGDRILWLPNMGLTGLPLSVLLSRTPRKAGEGYDLASADWLVRTHDIAYPGSAAMIVASRARTGQPVADFDFLGVGDPILSGTTEGGQSRGAILRRGMREGDTLAGLEPLPDTAVELEKSSRGFKTVKLLTQGEATERGVRGQMIGSYRYLSFATHGLLREDHQGLTDPALVLTPVSGDQPSNDGLFTASEIADLNLTARFVALSACNTANFDLSQASSDLPALASAFAVAGVPATLATLWPVDSQTSAQVVAGAFAKLRADPSVGPAMALAAAQRDFLGAPPTRAHLHPRFWSPFVVIGDGGGSPPALHAEPQALASMETLTNRGGEVLAIERAGDRVLTRLITDRDAKDIHGAGVRRSGAPGGWRSDTRNIGATRVLADLGGKVVAGGYRQTPQGGSVPALEVFDRATGAPAAPWIGEVGPGLSGFVMAGVRTAPDTLAFAVAQMNLQPAKSDAAGRLQVFDVGQALAPRLLFEVPLAKGALVDNLTLTHRGETILLTYTRKYATSDRAPRLAEDDYDNALCMPRPVTWIELRDARTGTLKASRTLPDVIVSAALLNGDDVLLGGSTMASCTAEHRAAVLALGPDLAPRPVYADASLGASEVRTLSAMPDGRVFVAAHKDNIFDYRPTAPRASASQAYGVEELPVRISAMILTLGRDGSASAPKMLDSGGYILLSASDASDPADILLGGSVGEQAAIFHLTTP